MTEHVDEVEHHDIQVILLQRTELLQQLVCISLVVDFMIGERVLASVTFHLCPDKRLFIQVLALFFVFIYPEIREHLSNLIGHQAAEDGIAGILGGCWQDAVIQILFHFKLLTEFRGKHAPLVITEIIEHYQEYLLAFVE